VEHDQRVSEGTREKLLLTAMHMYARQGIHEVSLRAISTAAGSRNSAAMHYHFTNKLGVLDALAGFIFDHLNEIGAEQQLYRRSQCSQDVGHSIKLVLLPIVEMADRYPWGGDAIRFLSRLLAESSEEYSAITIRHNHKFYRAADTFLADLLPQLDQQTRQLRMMFMAVNIFHGFAEIASLQRTPLGDLSQIDRDSLIDQLVTYLAGGLQAPMNSPLYTPTGETHERTAL
jgi:AcrR family transcriptional regulator